MVLDSVLQAGQQFIVAVQNCIVDYVENACLEQRLVPRLRVSLLFAYLLKIVVDQCLASRNEGLAQGVQRRRCHCGRLVEQLGLPNSDGAGEEGWRRDREGESR